MTEHLAGKVALITGAASGIGARCAERVVRAGGRCVLADMNEQAGQALADALGTGAHFVRVAVEQEAQVQAAVEAAVERFGALDVLVNNAGFGGVIGPLQDTPVQEWDLTYAVLVRGVFLGMKHALPVMKQQGSGSIVNVASVAGMTAGYSPHAYASAKAAVIQLTRSVAMEVAENGVRVNVVSPGFIATPLTTTTPGGAPIRDARDGLAALAPLGRPGEVDDIADAVLFLAGAGGGFVTGQNLAVDGGLTSGRRWSEQPAYFHRYAPIRVHRPDD